MKIRFTDEAKADLLQIGDYIARDNPTRALSFVEELEQKCRAIAASPMAFSLVPRYEQYAIRRCVYENYLIFYRIEDEQITVLHIVHGAMDYSGILFED